MREYTNYGGMFPRQRIIKWGAMLSMVKTRRRRSAGRGSPPRQTTDNETVFPSPRPAAAWAALPLQQRTALATLNTVVARDGDDMARLISRMLTHSPHAGTQAFYAALDEELPGKVRRDIQSYFCTGGSAPATAIPRIRAGPAHTALIQGNFELVRFISRLLTRVRTENTAAARQRFYRDLYRELAPTIRNDIRNQFCGVGAGVKPSRRGRTRKRMRRCKARGH